MSTKTKKPKLNVRLLRRIQKQILKEPRQFFMEWWTTDNPYQLGLTEIPNCGTAACIAGWAVALSRNENPSRYRNRGLGGIAAKILGVSQVDPNPNDLDSCSPADSLFCTQEWPARFRKQYNFASSPMGRARAAVARIEHLIKTGK